MKKTITVGFAALLLMGALATAGYGSGSGWVNAATFESRSSVKPNGVIGVDIKGAAKARFHVRTGTPGQRVDVSWSYWCVSEAGTRASAEKSATWRMDEKGRRTVALSLPFDVAHRDTCSVILQAAMRSIKAGRLSGAIQYVRR